MSLSNITEMGNGTELNELDNLSINLDSPGLAASYFMAIMCTFGIVSNFYVFYVESHKLCNNRVKQGYAFYTLLSNLFISDFLLCLFVMPIFLINAICGRWIGGATTCGIMTSTSIMFCAVSFLTMTFIAFDRYLLIVNEYKLKNKYVLLGLIIIWLWAGIPGMFPILVQNVKYPYSLTAGNAFCMSLWKIRSPEMSSYVGFCAGTLFLALALTCFFYCKVYTATSIAAQNVTSFISSNTLQHQNTFQRELALRMIILVAVFCFFWTPYLINMFYQLGVNNEPPVGYDIFSLCMCYTNSAINPIIYSCMTRRKNNAEQKSFIEKSQVKSLKRLTFNNQVKPENKPITIVITPPAKPEKETSPDSGTHLIKYSLNSTISLNSDSASEIHLNTHLTPPKRSYHSGKPELQFTFKLETKS